MLWLSLLWDRAAPGLGDGSGAGETAAALHRLGAGSCGKAQERACTSSPHAIPPLVFQNSLPPTPKLVLSWSLFIIKDFYYRSNSVASRDLFLKLSEEAVYLFPGLSSPS